MNGNEKTRAVTQAAEKLSNINIPQPNPFSQQEIEDGRIRTQKTPSDEGYMASKGDI